KRELARRGVGLEHLIETPDRRTPTYTKPMLRCADTSPQELNRLDIKNRSPMPVTLVREITRRLDQVAHESDAVIVADQVTEPECGIITLAVRERLSEWGERDPHKILFADSRERIGLYHNVIVKPNRLECLGAVGLSGLDRLDLDVVASAARELTART